MKVAVVTSSINYIPGNHDLALDQLLKNTPKNLVGLILVRTSFWLFLKSLIWLSWHGCWSLVKTLLQNGFRDLSGKRERRWRRQGLPVIKVNDINDPKTIKRIRAWQPDLVLNTRSSCLYGPKILAVPTLGCVNVHHGLLPCDRGRFCDLYALAENRPAGFSLHRMTKVIDGGGILMVKTVTPPVRGDYPAYLQVADLLEGRSLSEFIQRVQQEKTLPPETVNRCGESVIYRWPSGRQLKEFKQQGIRL